MKHYNSYMDRQEISPAVHEKLSTLEVRKKSSSRMWMRVGALAACAALIVGAGIWRLSPPPVTVPEQGAGQFAAGYTPLPGQKDTVGPEDLSPASGLKGAADFHGFVVSSPEEGDKLMFPMIPAILYQDVTGNPELARDIAWPQGSFLVDLEKEDIQTIFWGPEGKPEAEHPKTEQGDLPWMLFWDGYTVHGYAWYNGQGELLRVMIYGEKDIASFELALCPGYLPPTCIANPDLETSEAFGVSVAGWSRSYDRNGDGQTDYICGSEFMTESDIGVRFVNQNSTMQAEYGDSEDIYFGDVNFGGACTFNSLFVRQALPDGLYLDHLKTNENIPDWREETFETLAQARQEAEFAPYLPTSEPEGYSAYTGNKEFYGCLSYQEGTQNMLFVRWSREYDDVEVCVYRDGTRSYDLANPDNPASYDVRMYEIPWCDSVPEEYRETINRPAFKAEDMSLAIVEARGREKDTGSMRFNFEVLHSDGTLVNYSCDGLTAQQVWKMVEETLD